MNVSYQLAYGSSEEFLEAIDFRNLTIRDRVTVRIESGSDYVFTYMGSFGDQINGISALNHQQIAIDLETMTLTEHKPA